MTKTSRLASIESFRVVAMFIVICLHANLFGRLHVEAGSYGFLIDFPLYLLFWFAVPYFFLVSGYFYGKKLQAGHEPISLCRRSCMPLLWLYLIWSAIYAVIPRYWLRKVTDQSFWQSLLSQDWPTVIGEHLRAVLMPWPPYYHLWFLPALMLGLLAVTFANFKRSEKHAMPLLAALYACMVAAELFFPREGVEFHPARSATLAVFFTTLGWWVSYQRQLSVSLALTLLLGGATLAVTEGIVLKLLFRLPTIQIHWYPYAGAALSVLGLFILLLSRPAWGQGTRLAALGQYTLGVYLCHIFIEHTLAPLHDKLPHLSAVWYVPYVVAVYTLSLLLTWLCIRIPWCRTFVIRNEAFPRGVSDDDRLLPKHSGPLNHFGAASRNH